MPLIDLKEGYSRAMTAKPAQLARSAKYSAKYGDAAQKAYTKFRKRIEASDAVLFANARAQSIRPRGLEERLGSDGFLSQLSICLIYKPSPITTMQIARREIPRPILRNLRSAIAFWPVLKFAFAIINPAFTSR
jgi:hypothetical protein